jgi:hypothetical protein
MTPFDLLFAREPEPDVEFAEEDLEEPVSPKTTKAGKPPKQSGGRPLLWLFVALLIGAVIYVAMEPEMLVDLAGSLLGESSPKPQVAVPPAPPAPKPPEVSAPTTTAPGAEAPVTPPPSTPAPMSPPVTAAPPSAAPPAPTAPAPLAPPALTMATLPPLFGEGQQATVVADTFAPNAPIFLTMDAAGMRPGPTVRPGSTVTVLDGELHDNTWVYSVLTEEGAKGWIPERRLKSRS